MKTNHAITRRGFIEKSALGSLVLSTVLVGSCTALVCLSYMIYTMRGFIIAFLITCLSVGCQDSSAPRKTDELYYAWLFGLIPTQDGGYLTAVTRYHTVHVYDNTKHPSVQYVDPASTYGDMMLIKTDANGNKQWEKVLEKPDGQDGITVVQLPNGNYLLAGNTTSENLPQTRVDVDLNEVGPDGQERGSARLANHEFEMRLTDFQIGPLGSLFAAGSQLNPGLPKGWLRRISQTDKSTQWEILTTGPPQKRQATEAITVAPDGGLFATGYESGQTYFRKISPDGIVGWTQYVSDTLLRLSPRRLYATADGGFLLTGSAFPTLSATNLQAVLLKADASGKTQSIRWFDLGPYPSYEERAFLMKRPDGHFVLATWDTDRRIDLMVLDANGGSPKSTATAVKLFGYKKPLFLPLANGETILVEFTGSTTYEQEITMHQIGLDGKERWQRVIARL